MSHHHDDVRNWQVLVVDDNEEVATIVRHFLSAQGAEVFIATTGKDAYEILLDLNPTFILLDLTLPDTDGFAILDTVRMQMNYECPIIAFTARSRREALGLIDRGFDGYILKPFRMSKIIDDLVHILQQLE